MPAQAGGPSPYAGGLVVNVDHRSVLVHERELDLTRREFDLLAHLVGGPRRVHTRQQLLDTLWPANSDASTRTVDVHVHRLRAKLGPHWATALTTVRGVGYRWTPPTEQRPHPGRRQDVPRGAPEHR